MALPLPFVSAPVLAQAWTWEDSALLVSALQPEGRVLGVEDDCGDLALGLLAAGAREVHVLPTDPAARALLDLKHAGALTLPRPTLRSLLGLDAAGRRVFLYHYVARGEQEGRGPPPPGLSGPSRLFWDGREALLRQGLAGAREGRTAALRRVAPLLPGRPSATSPAWRAAARLLHPRPATPAAGRLARLWLHRLDQGAPLAHFVLAGPEGDRDPAPWLSAAGLARIAARSPLHIHERPSGLPPLEGLALGTPCLDPSLGGSARRLAPGAPLFLRAPTPPRLPGLRLDEAGSARLQELDRALLEPPPWLYRAAP